MNSRPAAFALPLLVVLPIGWVMRSLEPEAMPLPPAIRGADRPALAGPGGLPGLFDGVRPILAGGCWLRANLAWEKRDQAATLAWLELTVAADARPAYFWLNGARMIAYDMPGWEAAEPRRTEAWACRALDFLETGLRRRGDDPLLLIEMANIHLRRRGDWEKAAGYYRRAAERPGAPYYAARIHAELLQALGRPEEALTWLRRILPDLPADDAAARRSVVEARIKALEMASASCRPSRLVIARPRGPWRSCEHAIPVYGP